MNLFQFVFNQKNSYDSKNKNGTVQGTSYLVKI